jgi:glycosyltransferase involved in cell wall biosynthesis
MKISIVVPHNDSSANIGRTIESIKIQHFDGKEYEIIIINSCNDLESEKTLSEIEKASSDNVVLVNVPFESTKPEMLNIGMSYASGDYLMFVLPGDVINPHLLKVAGRIIRDLEPELISYRRTIVHDRFDMYEDDPFSLQEFTTLDLRDKAKRLEILSDGNIDECYLCHIYKKELLDDVGMQFEDDIEDEDMVFSYPLFLLADSIAYTGDYGYCSFFRLAKRDVTSKVTGRMTSQTRMYEILRGNGDLYNEYKDIIDAHFVKEYFVRNLKLARGANLGDSLRLNSFEVMQYVTHNLVPKWIENDYIFSLNKDEMRLMCMIYSLYSSDEELDRELKKDALVTVITTTYNRCEKIRESIECILRQSYQYFEYIIVDDGSPDDTEKVVKTFDDPRIKFIRNPENKGLCYSRNVGIKNSSGKYIVCQDDDDFCRLDKLEKEINCFMGLSDDFGMVYCESISHIRRLAGRLDDPAIMIPDREMSDVRKKGYIFPALLARNHITSTAAMMRRECMEKVGLYDENLFGYEDWDIYLRIARKYKAEFIREPMYDYYQRPGTLISSRNDEHRRKILKSLYDIDQKFLEDRKIYGIEFSFKIVES